MLSIISTVGLTVFGGYQTPLNSAAREFEQSNPRDIRKIVSDKTFPGEEIYRQALADLQAKSGDFLRKACAEVNAIEGIHATNNVRAGNVYHFLASDTPSGLLAARVLADFCKEHYQATEAKVHLIQGLQVKDERGFRLTGLPSLVQKVYECLNEAKSQHLTAFLNPTGGFKAAISYLTLVGMLRQKDGVKVSCIHETSTQLITLGGLPVALDLAAIGKIAALLEECDAEQESGLSRPRLMQGLGLNRNEMVEDHPFWSLFEQFDSEHYILSGLGSIALAELRSQARLSEVWLTHQALERLNKEFKPGSVARQNFETIFDRLRDPLNRVDPYRHTYKGSSFPAFKYKGNERLFYHENADGSVWVLELAQHVSDSDYSYDRIPAALTDYTPAQRWPKE
jgi:putative CRISPR-associated protein (TIGR02619 family)